MGDEIPRSGFVTASLSLKETSMSNAATAFQPELSTEAVLRNHLQAAKAVRDAIMQDYTERSVLITADRTCRGPAQIRSFFTALFDQPPAGFFPDLTLVRQEIVGEMAYILSERKPQIARPTDT